MPQHANDLSIKNSGHSFSRAAASIVCQFSLGTGGSHRFGTRRFCAMGTLRSGRTSFSPPADSFADNQPSSLQKVSYRTIITAAFGARPGHDGFIPVTEPPPSPRLHEPARPWDRLYLGLNTYGYEISGRASAATGTAAARTRAARQPRRTIPTPPPRSDLPGNGGARSTCRREWHPRPGPPSRRRNRSPRRSRR